MKSRPSALTASALASAAARKASTAQRKLKRAEADLRTSTAVLAKKAPDATPKDLQVALRHNRDAEAEMHQASEELEAVAHLLGDMAGGPEAPHASPAPPPRRTRRKGKTGEGAKSLIAHLRKGG